MKMIFTTYMARLLIGGIICGVAISLCADTGKKELVRICSACIMIILVLSPFKGESLYKIEFGSSIEDTKEYIAQAVVRSEEEKYNSAAVQINDYIRQRAEDIGINCMPNISWYIGVDGEFTISGVRLKGVSGERSKLEELFLIISQECGVDSAYIFIEEE